MTRLHQVLLKEKEKMRDLKRAASQQRETDKQAIANLQRELEVVKAKESAAREMLAMVQLSGDGGNGGHNGGGPPEFMQPGYGIPMGAPGFLHNPVTASIPGKPRPCSNAARCVELLAAR